MLLSRFGLKYVSFRKVSMKIADSLFFRRNLLAVIVGYFQYFVYKYRDNISGIEFFLDTFLQLCCLKENAFHLVEMSIL